MNGHKPKHAPLAAKEELPVIERRNPLNLQIGERFRLQREMIDATSMHRPDTSWKYLDSHGHTHAWHLKGEVAKDYDPRNTYDLPTLVWVKTDVGYYEDGTEYEIGHMECTQCREEVKPQYCADSNTQYVPGLMRCYVDGESVSREVFAREFVAAGGVLPKGWA